MKLSVKSTALIFAFQAISISAWAVDASTQKICQPKSYEMGLRYQQKSAEILALQLQTYRFAKERFAQKVAELKDPEKYAVVMDLDETVLDNSKLLARDLENCHDYTAWDTWEAWEKKGKPDLIPGAKSFLEAVDQAKVRIYYVSDRSQKNKAETMQTLKELGLPQVTDNQVLLDTDSKEVRRQTILKDYKILMLFGDSLPDFAAQFKNKKTSEQQRGLVEKSATDFGDDWIILPNSAYGSWSTATLDAWKE